MKQVSFTRIMFCNREFTNLEPYPILGNLLRALIFGRIWRFNPELDGQLGPGLDFLVIEALDKLIDDEWIKRLSPTAWRIAKRFAQAFCIRRLERHCRVAVKDEADVGILNRV